MDIILTIVCLIIAIMLVLGKPIKIHVEHHHSVERDEAANGNATAETYDKQDITAFDKALSEIHSIMGVSEDEE